MTDIKELITDAILKNSLVHLMTRAIARRLAIQILDALNDHGLEITVKEKVS